MKKPEKKDKFLEMRIAGDTFEKIAKTLEVSKQTLINCSKETEIKESIDIAQQIRYQSILKQYQVARNDKVKFYASLLKRVNAELNKTDLAGINPDKLLEIALKCEQKLSTLAEGKLFGGGSTFDEIYPDRPCFYFDPED